jgi:hypothetical protein
VWEVPSGDVLATIRAPEGVSAVLSADGKMLVTMDSPDFYLYEPWFRFLGPWDRDTRECKTTVWVREGE